MICGWNKRLEFAPSDVVVLVVSLLFGLVRSDLDLSTSPPTRVLTMCYLIERNTVGMTYDFNKAAAALDLAKNYANSYVLPPEIRLRSVYRDVGQTCSTRTHVVGTALKLRDQGVTCDVYIGPGCGLAVEIFNDLMSVWDVPIIGCPASGLGMSAPAADYDIVTRTSVTYMSITRVLMRFFDKHNYTSPAIFEDQSVNFFQQLGVLMESIISKEGSEDLRYGVNFIQFQSANDTKEEILDQIMKAANSSRVFVIDAAARFTWNFMLWAEELGMTNGDYIFIAVELFPSDVWGPYTWSMGSSLDSAARRAFRCLALLSMKTVTTDSAAEFWQQVIKDSKRNYGYEFTPAQRAQIDPIVAHFYDSVLLYALVVTLMDSQGLNYSSGLAFTAEVANSTFDSPVTGAMTFNPDSDRVLDFTVRFFNEKTGKHDAVFDFLASISTVKVLGNVNWFGGSRLPSNAPFCGFRGENPKCAPVYIPLSTGSKAGIAIASVIFVLCLGLAASWLSRKLMYSSLDPFWWRILEHDLAIMTNGTRSSKSAGSLGSLASVGMTLSAAGIKKDGNGLETATMAPIYSSGKTAMYNGVLVSLLELPEPKLRVPPNILRDSILVRSMQHSNIQKFIGIAVDESNVCDYIVAEICQKGSLQDLIEDQQMTLDWEFKHALIKDLANGMVYVHSSSIESHGFLNDASCLIDSRFILKIGNYGFDCLRHREDLEAFHITQAEHRNLRLLLWRAPELLRRSMPPAGTQKGDVYSFAILLQQIVLRTEPFHKGHQHHAGKEHSILNTVDIVDEVCRGLVPPLRPPVPMSACSHEMHTLMENCWNEEPLLRPSFVRIRSTIQNAFKKSGDNIVDHLIKRMETHAANLEGLVIMKTKEFMDERTKSADILQDVLPKSVAETLAKGLEVMPETFSSATIYVGSVGGFQEAVSQARSPLEIIKLVNDLHGICDGVIEGLDVFKVEVLIDAYMVVSGLPIKNGMRHVESIASMALTMRKEVHTLTTSNKDVFKLRVGIHTGPCVAGVIGLKLPRYYLFGDTLTIAHLMESHGEAGKIHVSASSKALLDLHDDFVLVDRGTTNLKGKEEASTYWLVGRN